MSMRVAAFDCGTNSIRLLVAEGDAGRPLVDLDRRLELNRLGQGVDATGRFAPEALERTFGACDRFAAVIAELDADRVRFVATSAARDALNRDEFFAGVLARLGVAADVISGEEEARLSFRGALSGVGRLEEPMLVMDLGGGSTELVTGNSDGQILAAVSLNMGSVRVRERFLLDEVPTPAQVVQARAWVDEQLDACGVPFDRVRTWIGVAGTATSMSAMQQELVVYDRSRVHGSTLDADQIAALTDRLLSSTIEQIMTMGPLQRRRAEVIGAGALICQRLATRLTCDLLISESDILDGLAMDLLTRP